MSLLLEGKRAFITGGTRGIGAALCDVFAREGADVAFNYNSRDDLAEETIRKIEGHGRRAKSFKVSIVDRFGMKHLTRGPGAGLGRHRYSRQQRGHQSRG